MDDLRIRITEIIEAGVLPGEKDNIIEDFLSDSREEFVEEESVLWDYKREFPFSRSDDYCGGIIRLICALHNTFGGIIIFGVHDKRRTAGHNKVKIEVESFNTFLREVLSHPIECQHMTYPAGTKFVDVLFVPKREQSVAPVKTTRSIGVYMDGIIYIRKNHEVLNAASGDIPFLFSNRASPYAQETKLAYRSRVIDASLPSSPTTLKTFVGRIEVLEQLWHWLFHSRDSRRFLWGDGGSGKTTVAFEFAKLVADHASEIPTFLGREIDIVLFLSAKRRELDPLTRQIVQKGRHDFSDAEDLFRQILHLSNMYDTEFDKIEALSGDELELKLEEVLNAITFLLIVDDIDTLTTEKKDSGAELLSDLLSRSKSGSKVIYTLRNLPALAIRNSIEVPGLDRETEYKEFVETCCGQFQQPMPSDNLLFGDMERISSRRPLVLEVIIGLRRTCGSFEAALEAYQGQAGDRPRSYLFEREYNALSDSFPKNLLAALYLLGKPSSFGDLEVILRFDQEKLRNSIGEVSDMFLNYIEDDATGEALFSLNEVASGFIKNVCIKLDKFETLKNRVLNYQRGEQGKSAVVEQLILRIDQLIQPDPDAAFALLFDREFEPEIMERSDFRALRGFVASKQQPPKIDLMRTEMMLASDIGRVDHNQMREWYYREMDVGSIREYAIPICDRIINGKGYRPYIRAEFYSRKGYACFRLAQQNQEAAPEQSLALYARALESDLQAFATAANSKRADYDGMFDRTVKCIYSYYNFANKADSEREFFDKIISMINDKDYSWDPLLVGFEGIKGRLLQNLSRRTTEIRSGKLVQLKKYISQKRTKFEYEESKKDLIGELSDTITKLDVIKG